MGLFNKVFGKPKNTQASQPVPLTPWQEYMSVCEEFGKRPYQQPNMPGEIAYFTYASPYSKYFDKVAIFDDERLYWKEAMTGASHSISVRSIQDWSYQNEQMYEFDVIVVGFLTTMGEYTIGLEKHAFNRLIACIQAIQRYDHSVKDNMNDEELFNEIVRQKYRMAVAGGMNCNEVYPGYFDKEMDTLIY